MLTLAHLTQDGPDALFRQTSLTLPLVLQALDALQRRQKPYCFWLAIKHGDTPIDAPGTGHAPDWYSMSAAGAFPRTPSGRSDRLYQCYRSCASVCQPK
jgi:hypothetical protein